MKGILSKTTIYEVTEDVIQGVIDNQIGPDKYGEPYELMWFYDEKADKYIGCDNSDGCAWVEEFDTLTGCIAWLLDLDAEEA